MWLICWPMPGRVFLLIHLSTLLCIRNIPGTYASKYSTQRKKKHMEHKYPVLAVYYLLAVWFYTLPPKKCNLQEPACISECISVNLTSCIIYIMVLVRTWQNLNSKVLQSVCSCMFVIMLKRLIKSGKLIWFFMHSLSQGNVYSIFSEAEKSFHFSSN